LSKQSSKITIVGSGAIGSAIAYSLLLRRAKAELVLVNRDGRRSGAKAFDMSHCLPGLEGGSIRAGGAEEGAGSDIVVLTAGVLPKAEGKRSDVLRDNIELYRSLLPPLAALCPRAVFLVVTNPNDAMAYAAQRISGLEGPRVLGTGTLLDGLRLRGFIAEAFGLEPAGVEALIVGEHGDTMVPLWSGARYAGRALGDYLRDSGRELDAEAKGRILEKTRRAGWEIRLAGEHSCYGISFSALTIIEAILDGSEEEITLSAPVPGASGERGLFMSLPVKLGREGFRPVPPPAMSEDEAAALRASSAALRAQMDAVDELLGPPRAED
jgi:L-lactate dehydrogenase